MARLLVLLVFTLTSSLVPLLPAPVLAQGDTVDEQNAATVAYDISVLEAAGSFGMVYDRMHPDARAFIPREAVVGWYENDLGPKQPQPITVTDVQMVEWVWPVTGKTYPYTAEVAFEQSFGDGTTITDVVRLVQDDAGSWRWFFGRSREFVDTQITRYAEVDANANADPTMPTTTVSSSARSSAGSSSCELVELYPGYPGYRGYITGLVGAGDHECLSDLQARNPSFSRAGEDLQNNQAASRLGISGPMNVWTWENWMAIEAERGLPPTCYSCLLVDSGQAPEHNGAFVDPNDPRLLIGTSLSYFNGDDTAVSRLSQKHGRVVPLTIKFPTDQHLRTFTAMHFPGRHLNAEQIFEAFDEVVTSLSTRDASGNYTYLDPNALLEPLLNQGGYAPTPATAYPEDQIFTIYLGYVVASSFMSPWHEDMAMSKLDRAAEAWMRETLSNPTPSFAEYLRREGF